MCYTAACQSDLPKVCIGCLGSVLQPESCSKWKGIMLWCEVSNVLGFWLNLSVTVHSCQHAVGTAKASLLFIYFFRTTLADSHLVFSSCLSLFTCCHRSVWQTCQPCFQQAPWVKACYFSQSFPFCIKNTHSWCLCTVFLDNLLVLCGWTSLFFNSHGTLPALSPCSYGEVCKPGSSITSAILITITWWCPVVGFNRVQW